MKKLCSFWIQLSSPRCKHTVQGSESSVTTIRLSRRPNPTMLELKEKDCESPWNKIYFANLNFQLTDFGEICVIKLVSF